MVMLPVHLEDRSYRVRLKKKCFVAIMEDQPDNEIQTRAEASMYEVAAMNGSQGRGRNEPLILKMKAQGRTDHL